MSRLVRQWLRRSAAARPAARTHAPSPKARLLVQALEGRVVPATFTVTGLGDTGAGSGNSGDLRYCITQADAAAGADVIAFQAGVTGTIALESALPAVTDPLTINGPGAAALTVSRDPAAATTFRILTINATTTVSGLTLTGGQAIGTVRPDRSGGGIFVNSNVVATVLNSVVAGNTASGEGGGINVSTGGTLTVRNSTISGNTAGTGAGFRTGGGIYFRSGGSLLLENSTVSGNSSLGRGGGVYLYGNATTGTWTVRNSTISGNTSGADGGGLVFYTYGTNNNHSLTVQNTTITANTAVGNGGGFARVGGPGTAFTGTVTFESTIVANNTAGANPDFSGPATVNFSLVRDQTGATITGSNNLPAGTDPLLGPLANNGGPTQTHAIPGNSPARDAGSNPAGVPTDQRGPGFPRQIGPTDIGAFEFVPPGTPTAGGTFANVTTPGGATYPFQVTYTDDVSINTSTLGNGDVRVTGPGGYNQLATFVSSTGSGPSVTATYTVPAPGGTFDGPDSGVYTVAVEPSQVADNQGNFVPAGVLGSFTVLLPQTFTVTTLADSGPGSFRDAVTRANALPGTADTIAFAPNLTGTINLQSALPTLSDGVTITGPGPAALTIRRDPAAATQFRIFNIDAPGVQSFTITGLTISGGLTGTNAGNGGGTANDGAGILLLNDTLTLDRVAVSGNTSGSEGGGIAVGSVNGGGGGSVTVRNSTVSGNTASGVPPAGSFGGGGGGIYFANGGTLLVENSTVSGNVSVNQKGGGMYLYGGAGVMTATIRNSTITGNTAANVAGGILFYTAGTNPTHNLTVQNTTIAGNSAGGGGGGLVQAGPVGAVALQSTVIANNLDGTAAAPDVSGAVTADHSLIRNAAGATITDAGGNLAAGTDPLFAPAGLAANGGPTPTIALQSTSPLINAGSNPAGLATDQRGRPRVVGAAADIGAYEFGPTGVQTVQVSDGSNQRSVVRSITVTFTGPVTFAGGNTAAAFQLARTGPTGPTGNVTLTPTVTTDAQGETVVTLKFSGPLTESNTAAGVDPSLIDGLYTLTVFGGQATGAEGLAVDGDGNGTPGGNAVMNFHRLYGDFNGDRTVDPADIFPALQNAIFTSVGQPGYTIAFDFDGNGVIDPADIFPYLQQRLFTSI